MRNILADEELDSLSPEQRRQALFKQEDRRFDPLQYLHYEKSEDGQAEVHDVLTAMKPWWLLPTELPLSAHEIGLLESISTVTPHGVNGSTLALPLLEFLYCYIYNFLTTGGEDTVESAWTVISLSSSLSGFCV